MTRTEGWLVTIELIGQRLVGTGESMEALVAQLPEGRTACLISAAVAWLFVE
jgi:hypothetical protein